LSRSRRLLCTSVAAALALAAPRARAGGADERVDTYRAAVARGQAAFDDGRYAIARAEFRAAFDIHAEPVLLFNIASTYRREGELERAIEHYREFLDLAPSHPRAHLAAQTIRELEEEIAAREAAPAPELVPDAEAPEPPGLAPALVDDDGDDGPGRPGNRYRWISLTAGAGAAVTAGLAVYAARDAARAERALEALGDGDEWGLEQQALYDEGVASRRKVLLFSAASAALVTTGVVLYVVGERRRAREATTLTVAPTQGGGVVGLAGAF
jgi:tetratricopeptide (TPR) repeat protein